MGDEDARIRSDSRLREMNRLRRGEVYLDLLLVVHANGIDRRWERLAREGCALRRRVALLLQVVKGIEVADGEPV
jgi:hypothetical protein